MSELLSTRLNKYISQSGLCSRRDADKFIEQGHVFINGRRAEVGDRVFAGSKVAVNGQQIEPMDEELLVLIALNKPVGVVSTTEGSERNNIVNFVGHSSRIFPIGRLDKDSQGLIFLTNNGDLVNKILRAGNSHEKEYLVTVNRPITDDFIQGLSNGVPILGVMTKKCSVTQVSPFVFKMILVQGLNRQIRRMCEYFNYEVQQLERTRIMNISLKGLPVGDWRDFSPAELDTIETLTEDSSSEIQAPKKPKSSHKSNAKSKSLSAVIEKKKSSGTAKPNRKEQLKNLLVRKKPTAHAAKKRVTSSVKGPHKPAAKITPKPPRIKSALSKKQRNKQQ